jgi:hypothetical protein
MATNERGQYGSNGVATQQPRSELPAPPRFDHPSWPQAERPKWTEGQKRDLTRAFAASSLGAVAGAVLWKDHRIWGFILGGMAGGAVGNLIFAPPSTFP